MRILEQMTFLSRTMEEWCYETNTFATATFVAFLRKRKISRLTCVLLYERNNPETGENSLFVIVSGCILFERR